jgi:hypothetical protein
MDNQKVEAVLQWPMLGMVRTACVFLSLAGYYRRFIRDYGSITVLLTKLLCKDVFKWSAKVEFAFRALQQALISAPVLQLPTFDKDFIVECDALGHGFGSVLHQGTRLVAFFNWATAPRHTKLAAYERELIGLVQAVKHWRPYLWGHHLLI